MNNQSRGLTFGDDSVDENNLGHDSGKMSDLGTVDSKMKGKSPMSERSSSGSRGDNHAKILVYYDSNHMLQKMSAELTKADLLN